MRETVFLRLLKMASDLRDQGMDLVDTGVGGACDAIVLWQDAIELLILCRAWTKTGQDDVHALQDDLYGSLGEVLLRRREPQDAVINFENQLLAHVRRFGHSSVGLFKIYFNLATAYLGIHNIETARTFANRGIDLSAERGGLVVPYLVRIYYVLCRIERHSFNNEAGKAAIERALALVKADPKLLPADEAALLESIAASMIA